MKQYRPNQIILAHLKRHSRHEILSNRPSDSNDTQMDPAATSLVQPVAVDRPIDSLTKR